MGALLALARVIDRINEFIGKSVSWLILVAVLVSATNAAVRKIFDISSNAWLEAQWYLFGAAFLLAAAYTLKQNEHIRIDIVYGAFSRRVQHWIDLFGHVFFLMPFLVLMLWLMFPWLMMSVRSGEVSTFARNVCSHADSAASTTSPGTIARMQARTRRAPLLATFS